MLWGSLRTGCSLRQGLSFGLYLYSDSTELAQRPMWREFALTIVKFMENQSGAKWIKEIIRGSLHRFISRAALSGERNRRTRIILPGRSRQRKETIPRRYISTFVIVILLPARIDFDCLPEVCGLSTLLLLAGQNVSANRKWFGFIF